MQGYCEVEEGGERGCMRVYFTTRGGCISRVMADVVMFISRGGVKPATDPLEDKKLRDSLWCPADCKCAEPT